MAVVQVQQGNVLPGDKVVVAWSAIDAPMVDDWIGLFRDQAVSDATRQDLAFTAGAASGTASLQVPLGAAPGTYYVRLFPHNTWSPIASATVVVGTPPLATPPPASLPTTPPSQVIPGGGGGGGGGGNGGVRPSPAPAGGLDLSALARNPVVLGGIGLLAAMQMGLFRGGRRR